MSSAKSTDPQDDKVSHSSAASLGPGSLAAKGSPVSHESTPVSDNSSASFSAPSSTSSLKISSSKPPEVTDEEKMPPPSSVPQRSSKSQSTSAPKKVPSASKHSRSLLSPAMPKPRVRRKVKLAPGHSQLDWIKKVKLAKPLGQFRMVTREELAQHNTRKDAWISIRGIVYDVTNYLDFHPGGVPELMRGVGTEATQLFDEVHSFLNINFIMSKSVVGKLVP